MTLLGGQGEHFGLGLGEMFEGDSADMCARKFPLMLMGSSGGSSVGRPGSEDPHRRERNLCEHLHKVIKPLTNCHIGRLLRGCNI